MQASPRAVPPVPGVVFYQDSLYNPFDRKPRNTAARCNCMVACNGALAEVQCMSCAVFHPRKVALYCRSCFEKRHPPYRVAHKFVPISQYEDVEHVKQMRQANIQAERSVAESQFALSTLRSHSEPLQSLQYSEATEQKIRKGARLLLDMEQRLLQVKQRVKASVAFTATENAVTVRIQQLVRGYIARRRLSRLVAKRLVRVWSKQLHKWHVYDAASKRRRQWLFQMVQADHRHAIRIVWHGSIQRLDEPASKWAMCYFLKPNKRKGALTENKAAEVIQSFFWCIRARRASIARAASIYERKFDEEFERVVYVNTRTGKELWNKPLVLCSFEALGS